MFKFAVEIQCKECETPFTEWAYAPRVPIAGEFITTGGHDYKVIAVKLRLLTDEENRDPTSQRIVTAVCLVCPTTEEENF